MKLSKKNESIDLFQTPIEMAKQLYQGVSESIDERITVPKKPNRFKQMLKEQNIRLKDLK
tara:strand:- start:33 stop:212 length:180 start_codon:yes stop_codon:yes gene_type:complete